MDLICFVVLLSKYDEVGGLGSFGIRKENDGVGKGMIMSGYRF